MAYSNADIPSDERTWLADDKPLIIGRNWLRYPGVDARWNTAGTIAAADASSTDGPANYAYDEFDHLRTKPNAAGGTWYYVMKFPAAAAAEIDCVVLLNHTLGTTGSNDTVMTVQIGNTDFAANLEDVATYDPDSGDNKRVALLDLDHTSGNAQRYTSVEYLRLKFVGTNIQPNIGEIIIGRRRQLKHKSNLPWDPSKHHSETTEFVTHNGIRTRYVRNKGQQRIVASLTPSDTTLQSDIETFYKTETDFGTLPFVWIEDPNTTPSDALWMHLDNPDLNFPFAGFAKREVVIDAREQGPNFLALGT